MLPKEGPKCLLYLHAMSCKKPQPIGLEHSGERHKRFAVGIHWKCQMCNKALEIFIVGIPSDKEDRSVSPLTSVAEVR